MRHNPTEVALLIITAMDVHRLPLDRSTDPSTYQLCIIKLALTGLNQQTQNDEPKTTYQ